MDDDDDDIVGYWVSNTFIAQSAGAVEYTNCIPTERKDPTKECPDNDTKQSDWDVPVMLELWGMRGTPSLPLVPGPLWPGVVASDRVQYIGQIELNSVFMLKWII